MTDYSIVDDWYGRYIPYRFSDLLSFVLKSKELTRGIVLTPIVIDSKAHTAYMKDGYCYLPALFFYDKFYSDILEIPNRDKIHAAIGIINGAQIHEAMHHLILGAKANYLTILDETNHRYGEKPYNTEVFKSCWNIIEDIYSNYRASIEYPFVYGFVDILIQTMFNENVFNRAYEAVYVQKNAANILNLLTCYQNESNLLLENQATIDYQEHRDVMSLARDEKLTLQDRMNIAYKLWELLKEECGEVQDFDNSIDSDESGLSIDSDEMAIVKNGKESDKLVRMIAKLKDELQEIEFDFKYDDSQKTEFSDVPVEYRSIMDYQIHVYELKFDNRFAGFSQLLRSARAERQKEVQPRLVGSKFLMNRLATGIEDGKIFGRPDTEFMEKGEPELIFLLDLSGSMTKGEWRTEGALIYSVINASYTVFRDLKENAIRCAFYGHTTIYDEYDGKVLIVGIAANDMILDNKHPQTTLDWKQRFQKINSIENYDNGDGFALKFVGSRFTEKPGTKAIIVLSDGQPAFSKYEYYGKNANKHISQIAEYLRYSNIKVLSLSLTKEVMKTNNEIYGNENNIAAYGENLSESLKKIITQLVV